MATFNQQGQSVETQYNAENINFGAVKNVDDFLHQLKQLQAEFSDAIEKKLVTDDKAIDAEFLIKKAIQQAEKSKPAKNTLVEYLSSAKDLVTNASGLAVALSAAITTAGSLF